jgi:hypothetical protein
LATITIVPQSLQLAADPGRLRARFERDPPRLSAEMFVDGTGLITEAPFLDDVAVWIDDAVPADLVSQIDADGLGKTTSASC